MKIVHLGDYRNKVTGKTYKVVDFVTENSHLGHSIAGSSDHRTVCGLNLNSLDDELNSFEVVETEEIIYKI